MRGDGTREMGKADQVELADAGPGPVRGKRMCLGVCRSVAP